MGFILAIDQDTTSTGCAFFAKAGLDADAVTTIGITQRLLTTIANHLDGTPTIMFERQSEPVMSDEDRATEYAARTRALTAEQAF